MMKGLTLISVIIISVVLWWNFSNIFQTDEWDDPLILITNSEDTTIINDFNLNSPHLTGETSLTPIISIFESIGNDSLLVRQNDSCKNHLMVKISHKHSKPDQQFLKRSKELVTLVKEIISSLDDYCVDLPLVKCNTTIGIFIRTYNQDVVWIKLLIHSLSRCLRFIPSDIVINYGDNCNDNEIPALLNGFPKNNITNKIRFIRTADVMNVARDIGRGIQIGFTDQVLIKMFADLFTIGEVIWIFDSDSGIKLPVTCDILFHAGKIITPVKNGSRGLKTFRLSSEFYFKRLNITVDHMYDGYSVIRSTTFLETRDYIRQLHNLSMVQLFSLEPMIRATEFPLLFGMEYMFHHDDYYWTNKTPAFFYRIQSYKMLMEDLNSLSNLIPVHNVDPLMP